MTDFSFTLTTSILFIPSDQQLSLDTYSHALKPSYADTIIASHVNLYQFSHQSFERRTLSRLSGTITTRTSRINFSLGLRKKRN
jgi:hypothetical protein